jgi:hypothetical protein
LANIIATDLRVEGHKKFAAVADGDARIELDEVASDAVSGSTRATQGGKIIEIIAEPDSETDLSSRFISR